MRKETIAIYFAGLVQGIALVAFPAVSTILTDPHQFHLSSTAYGSLFIPQAILSIIASALNPVFCRKFGSKSVFLCGLVANLLSMILLAISAFTVHSSILSYVILLCATGCLGLGFGLVVPTINAMAALLYPTQVDSILLMLNALLGIGTALAPIFNAFFVSMGFWWGLPLLLAILLATGFIFSQALNLPGGKFNFSTNQSLTVPIPIRFWIFASFALLYGIVETLNGNWLSIFMKTHLHASLELQSIALTAFWGMVTFGRVFFAIVRKYFREELIFQTFPFISTLAFIVIASLPPNAEYWAVAAFGLTGFGCSVLLPLIISFGNQQLKAFASSVPGMVISFYLLGYGIAAFGVGLLEDSTHMSLRDVYLVGAVVAFILGIISFFVTETPKNNHLSKEI
ncbi:MFS transporter [Parachlamydia acanthamoebae]|uniref:MFS transporter n=1 Tax=Parachlamydia acanthamoebae TaxID=83552 RepID=UPI000750863E|nr:MFS transporter [Parachlamydia acanthamoebae]